MKTLLPALFLLLMYSGALAQQLCGSPGASGNNCSNACMVCNLDGFSGTAGLNTQGNLPPGFCGAANAHPSWYGFGVQGSDISLRLDIGACNQGNSLSMGIYRANNCSNITLVSNCAQGIAAGSSVTLSASNLSATATYYLVVAGDQGAVCDFSVTVLSGSVTPPPLVNPSIVAPGSFCPGGNFGFSVSPVSWGATYTWSLNGAPVGQGANMNITLPPSPGSFQICVTPSNACSTGNQVCQSFIATPLPLLDLGTIQLCSGEVFQYAGMTFSTPGLYNINTITGNGCVQPVRFVLTIINIAPTHLHETICQGDSIWVGGLSIYLPGNYVFVLTSYLGCDSIVNINLNVLPRPTPSIAGDTLVCLEQEVIWTADGNGGNFTWRNAAGQVLGTGDTLTLPPGYEGVIHLTELDNTTGCEGETFRAIHRYPQPTLHIIPDSAAYCGTEPVTFTTEEGYPNTLWSTGAIGPTSEIIPNYPFWYYGYYSYANGCYVQDSAYIYISTPQVSISGDTSLCAGQFAVISVNGESDILWNTGDTTQMIMVTAFADTLITVSARDAGGCLGVDSVLLSFEPAPLQASLACQNASISSVEAAISLPPDYVLDTAIVVTGPAGQLLTDVYAWSGLQAGQSVVVEVRALSPEGCLSTATIGCTTLECSTANATIEPVGPLCTQGNPVLLQAALTGSQNAVATWNGTGIVDVQLGIFDPAAAGAGSHTVSVTLEDAGCSSEAQINLVVYQPASIADLNTACNGDEYTLSFVVSTADTSYVFTSAPTQSGTTLVVDLPAVPGCAPIHQEILRDCNCTTSAGQFLPQAPITVCGNEVLTIDLALNPVLGPGEQLLYVLHDNSGNVLGNIKAVYTTVPQIQYSSDLQYGVVYYLSPVAGVLLGNGQLDVGYACMDVQPGQGLVFQPRPQVSLPSPQLTICEGAAVALEAQVSGQSSMQWHPTAGLSCATCPATLAAPGATTTYTLEAFNSAGCSAEASVTINIEVLPSDIVFEDTISLCRGEDLDICLPDSYSYHWQGPNGFSSGSWCIVLLNVDDPVQGVYNVTITSASGCTFVENIVVDLAPEVTVSNLTPSQTVCPNQIVGLSAEVDNAIYYRWLPSNGLSCPSCLTTLAAVRRTTTFVLLVIDANGCTYEYPVTLTVDNGNCGGIITSQGLNQTGDDFGETELEFSSESTPTESGMSIFPNPATTQAVLLTEGIDITRVQLVDTQGRLCRSVEPRPAPRVIVSLDNLAAGVYVVWATMADGSQQAKKLVKL